MGNYAIIIPTHNRPAHLKRIISYYDSFGENFRVMVADSSTDEYKRVNKGIVASVSNLDILYLDDYPPETHPFQKFSDAVNHVEEKYCVFCADDDFIIPNGIKQSVDFLEKNPDFIVAQGRYISFKVKEGKRNRQKFRWNFAYDTLSIEDTDPGARLERHLPEYSMQTVYGVHRSDALKVVYEEVLKSGADLFMFGELLATALTILFGKMKYLDVFYAAKSEQTYGAGPGWPTVKDAIIAGTYDEKYPRFRDCLAEHLMNKTGLDIQESGKLVDKVMSAYLREYIAREILGLPKSKKRAVLDSLHLPDWMYNKILRSYFVSYHAIRTFSWYKTLIAKPSFPHSRHSDDFNRIRQCVLSSSETTFSKYT